MSALKSFITRHMSGDDEKQPGDLGAAASKSTSGIQNGDTPGKQTQQVGLKSGDIAVTNDNIAVIEVQGESLTDSRKCDGCDKVVPPGKLDKPSHLMCSFCQDWFCLQCAEFTRKPEYAVAAREDIFWGCKSCTSAIGSLDKKYRLEAIPIESETRQNQTGEVKKQGETPCDSNQEILTKMDEIKSSIEGKIEALEENLKNSVAKSLDDGLVNVNTGLSSMIKSSVTENLARAWNNTMFGDDDFPAVGSEEWKTVAYKNKKQTLPQVITRTFNEVNREQTMNEQRKNNVIIYRAPESKSNDMKVRQEDDKKLVDELLDQIEIQRAPAKIYRLGTYDADKQNNGSRPIKLEFEDVDIQTRVMTNAKKLKDAPEKLKGISLSYDMSKEQRAESKNLHEEAKEKTKNSQEFVYRVRGTPGNMSLIHFKKVAQ